MGLRGLRDHVRTGALLLGTLLALTACGDGSDTVEDDGAAAAASEDEAEDGGAGSGPEEEAADDGSAPPAELTVADAWNGPPAIEPPDEAGTAELRIDGQDVVLDVECEATTPTDSYQLFTFSAYAEGETDDGRTLQATATRELVDTEEASKSVYDYKGQESGSFQVTVAAEENQMHSSIVVSPGDDDPTGSHLPVVHVAEDGTYAASHDLEAMMMHAEALEGPAELAGRCQDGWDAELG